MPAVASRAGGAWPATPYPAQREKEGSSTDDRAGRPYQPFLGAPFVSMKEPVRTLNGDPPATKEDRGNTELSGLTFGSSCRFGWCNEKPFQG